MPALVKALEAGLKDPKSKGFVMKPNGEARYRFKWDGMTVQFNLYPKGPGKTSIVASQQKLSGAGRGRAVSRVVEGGVRRDRRHGHGDAESGGLRRAPCSQPRNRDQ